MSNETPQAIEWRNQLDKVRWQPAMSVSYYPWVRLWVKREYSIDPAGFATERNDEEWSYKAPNGYVASLVRTKRKALRIARRHIEASMKQHTERTKAAMAVFRPYAGEPHE